MGFSYPAEGERFGRKQRQKFQSAGFCFFWRGCRTFVEEITNPGICD